MHGLLWYFDCACQKDIPCAGDIRNPHPSQQPLLSRNQWLAAPFHWPWPDRFNSIVALANTLPAMVAGNSSGRDSLRRPPVPPPTIEEEMQDDGDIDEAKDYVCLEIGWSSLFKPKKRDDDRNGNGGGPGKYFSGDNLLNTGAWAFAEPLNPGTRNIRRLIRSSHKKGSDMISTPFPPWMQQRVSSDQPPMPW